MKQLFALSTLITLFNLAAQAQTSGRIAGTVQDGTQKTVASATISLLAAKDSSTVKLAVATKEGIYQFEGIANGQYLVSVTAVGHQKAFSSRFEISEAKKEAQVPAIQLVPISKAMSDITVVARKPLVEQKIDRTVVNVDASPTNVGSSAMEVLEKSPGLSVDKDGNISLKGKAGVMVMIDGRPTQLGGQDLANLLRSMNATELDQIEIMTNPPAKFDAAGNAGVINIKTKKNRMMGYNGTINLNYGQGIVPKFNEGINFNFRQGKWNLFTNLSHGYRENRQKLEIQRNFLNESTKAVLSRFDQDAHMRGSRSSYSGKLGADYFASKNTTLGVVVSGFSNPSTFQNNNFTSIYDASRVLTSQTRALSLQDETWKNLSTNLNFRQVLDTTGKELTADVDYITYDANSDQSLSNYYFGSNDEYLHKGDTLYGRLPQKIDIYSGRLDFTMPLKGGARFEAGVKASFVKTDANAIYDTVHNAAVIRDQDRSNHFIYEENINAAYVNLSGPLSKKWSGQLGLRLENTIAKGDQLTTDETFKRNYTQLFPTAFLQYAANEKNTFVLNYGRRIRRPNYESLNPFIEFLDRYTYQQGNPNLRPQFSHNIELSHSFKGFLTTTLNYTQTNDIIQQVMEQNEAEKTTFVKQSNIANQRQFGIAISANKSINKWWTNSFYLNVFNNHFEGVVSNEHVEFNGTMLMLNGTQQFKLGKTTSAEVSGWFRTAGIESVFQSAAVGGLNLGFSQQILKDKGTIRFTIRDVLYTQRFMATAKYGTVDAVINERGDSRVATIGFTYRFSKGKVGNVKRRASSANDEQNRVGQ
ncbi:MAG: TonB-dependent receptor [Chitinophagaceae bacterium]|nr:MAG: TonB-dependent receptor [Chitinophagaceae bacterium]